MATSSSCATVRRCDPGDIVLARFRSMPDLLVLKRVARPHEDGWWLASDNPYAGGDSTSHGVADVEARVVVATSTRASTVHCDTSGALATTALTIVGD